MSFKKEDYSYIDGSILLKNSIAVPHKWYAITINPDKYQNYNKPISDRLQIVYDKIRNILSCIDIDYELYPEITTGKAKIHYHGKIKYNNRFDYFGTLLPKLISIGPVNFKNINNKSTEDCKYKTWHSYCIKDRSWVRPAYINYNVPYKLKSNDDNNVLDILYKDGYKAI